MRIVQVAYRRQFLWALALAQVLLTLLFSGDVSAATRTFCFKSRMFDTRNDDDTCPIIGETGAIRGCNPGYYPSMFGVHFELWDLDDINNPASDDYIGTYIFTPDANGQMCVTFPWEGAYYQRDGDTHPIVYVVMKPMVQKSDGTGPRVEVLDDYRYPYFYTSFRSQYVKCYGLCYAPGHLDVTWENMPDVAAAEGVDMLDSAQHMLEIYGSIMAYNLIFIQYQNADCQPGYQTALNRANSSTEICINPGSGLRAETPPHELGHVLQKNMFHQDYLRDECNATHSLDTPAPNDSCATTEGWADYVGARSWFDPENTSAFAYYDSIELEPAAPDNLFSTVPDNSRSEGMAARGFWDLDDAHSEAAASPCSYSDVVDYDSLEIAQVWDNFPNGTGNGQDYESDPQGVNAFDYYNNGPLNFNRSVSFIQHNCLYYQDTN
jgi:hypothetical protein